MSPAAVALVLVSAFLHASWNALLKREPDTRVATAAILVVAALTSVVALPFTRGPLFPTSGGLAWSVVAGLCEAGYFLCLAVALSRAPMGLAYAIARGGATLIVWPVSVVAFAEVIAWSSALGSALVFVGLVASGVAGNRRSIGDARPKSRASGIVWAWLCAACIAGYHLAYKRALAEGAHATAVFAVALGLALPPSLGAYGTRAVVGLIAARPATLVLGGVVCAASFLLFLGALEQGGAGAVLTLRNTSVLFAYGFAYAIGERPTRAQLGGGLLIALGAVLLGLPRR